MPGLTSTRIPASPRILASNSPSLLERPASILLEPIFTTAALQFRHTALCIPGSPATEGNRPLQFTINPVKGVCQRDLLQATISGRVLDATLARLSKYTSGTGYPVSLTG